MKRKSSKDLLPKLVMKFCSGERIASEEFARLKAAEVILGDSSYEDYVAHYYQAPGRKGLIVHMPKPKPTKRSVSIGFAGIIYPEEVKVRHLKSHQAQYFRTHFPRTWSQFDHEE